MVGKYTYNDCDVHYEIKSDGDINWLQWLRVDRKKEIQYIDFTGSIKKGIELAIKEGCDYAFCVLYNASAILTFLNYKEHEFRIFLKRGEVKNKTSFKKVIEQTGDSLFMPLCKDKKDLLRESATIYFPLSGKKAFPFYFVEFDEKRKIKKISWDEPTGNYMIKYNIKPEDYEL